MATIELVHIARHVPAASAPGSKVKLQIDVLNRGPSDVDVEVFETIPPSHRVLSAPPVTRMTLTKGQHGRLPWLLVAPTEEGPALLTGVAVIRRGDRIAELPFETPIATYAPHPIAEPEQLIDVRDRLVAVTNFHRRNGYFLAMDAVRYFQEHLNVPLSAYVEKQIAEEFAFSAAGLPATKEDYEAMKLGDRIGLQFIEDITLEPFGDTPDDPCDEMIDRTYTREYPGVRS